ncbi:Murein L,D-transpeptidase YcbB/YkuD|nr:Murein L,D-transpeptidase YcbB/YkuD [Candidatus Pantoea persica]
MLLTNKTHQYVFSLLALALAFSPLQLTQAAVIAALPGTYSTAVSVSESQQWLRQAFAGKEQPFYLASLYAAHNIQPM